MAAYYNENNAYAAQWLRNLIAAGHIAAGDVDDRSIEDVHPDDLREYTQCHFFAGIGGWPYALRLAGVPDDVSVWTGSCPCQPFSTAGKQRGKQDERHLWPVWYKLIDQCRPAIVFGEQVASAIALEWLDDVFDGLENAGYACAAANLCAAGVGAPHIRQRIYWLAYNNGNGLQTSSVAEFHNEKHNAQSCSSTSIMADTFGNRPQGRILRRQEAQRQMEHGQVGRDSTTGDCLHYDSPWGDANRVFCRDGKWRPIPPEPSFFPLAARLSTGMGQLRAYGNAIVPQVAAEFVKAAFSATDF